MFPACGHHVQPPQLIGERVRGIENAGAAAGPKQQRRNRQAPMVQTPRAQRAETIRAPPSINTSRNPRCRASSCSAAIQSS